MSVEEFVSNVTAVSRTFEYDYIYFDAIFLGIWLLALILKKRFTALKAGIFFSIPTYLIDSQIWWNLPTTQGTTGFVREYMIGGIQMPHPLGDFFWLKFGADFMMTISYSWFAFTWMWIMFETWKDKNWKDAAFFTALWFISWILIPYLSFLISWDDRIVYCIRHMDSQMVIQIVTVVVGYILMLILYGTDKFNSKDPKVILYVFMVGCFQAFTMEFPLFMFGIRPIEISLFIYEIIILVNQGAPYMYVIWDKILPYARFYQKNNRRGLIKGRKNYTQEQEI
jgi:hypothetical protein